MAEGFWHWVRPAVGKLRKWSSRNDEDVKQKWIKKFVFIFWQNYWVGRVVYNPQIQSNDSFIHAVLPWSDCWIWFTGPQCSKRPDIDALFFQPQRMGQRSSVSPSRLCEEPELWPPIELNHQHPNVKNNLFRLLGHLLPLLGQHPFTFQPWETNSEMWYVRLCRSRLQQGQIPNTWECIACAEQVSIPAA